LHLDQAYAKLQIVHDMSILLVALLALCQLASVERLAELGKLWVAIR